MFSSKPTIEDQIIALIIDLLAQAQANEKAAATDQHVYSVARELLVRAAEQRRIIALLRAIR